MRIGHLWPQDTFLRTMATLEEVDSSIKEIAANIKTLKASGTAEPATVKQLVVSQRKGHSLDPTNQDVCHSRMTTTYERLSS